MITQRSRQSTLTQGRIAASQGRFDYIRQVALMCTSIQSMLPWAHPSPYPKRHHDRFSCFCTYHGRKSPRCTIGRLFPLQNCRFALDYLDPSNTWFLSFTRVEIQNDISIGSVVLQRSRSWQTDLPTDRPRYSVCNDRPHFGILSHYYWVTDVLWDCATAADMIL